MRLSREARILFAFVAVAAAAWIWINFFSRSNPTLTAEEAATEALTPEVATEANDAAADDIAADDAETDDAVLETGTSESSDTGAATSSLDSTTATGTETADSGETTPSETVEATAPSNDTVAVGGGTEEDAAASETASEATDAEDDIPLVADEADGEQSSSGETSGETTEPNVDDDMPLVADEPGDEQGSTAQGEAETTSVAEAQPVAARDVEIAELPFLVTEPPAPDTETLAEGETGLELARPRSGLRVTVNPFSPLVLAPQESTATEIATTPPPSTTPTTAAGIINVPIPNGPTTRLGTAGSFPSVGPGSVSAGINAGINSANGGPDLSDISAPVPRPLTPQPLQAGNLPRPLPGGTLSSTPDILRTTRAAPAAPANPLGATSLSDVAALRIPGQSGSAVSFNDAPAPALGGDANAAEPAPLPVSGRRPTEAAPTTTAPLIAGTSDLSNYLRDNNFQFTGSVIGPVGVGVFRSSLAAAPVTVVLGQALQDTDIVLTSLKGKQAEFTQNDEKQILTLDLR